MAWLQQLAFLGFPNTITWNGDACHCREGNACWGMLRNPGANYPRFLNRRNAAMAVIDRMARGTALDRESDPIVWCADTLS